MNPYFAVDIDWDNNNIFHEANEDVTLDVRVRPNMSASGGNDQLKDLSPPIAGIFSCDLDNKAGKYSANNSSSPLFGNLLPGRPARCRFLQLLVPFTPTATGNCYFFANVKPDGNAISTYTVKAGDILQYDVLWGSAVDYTVIDLREQAGHTFLSAQGFTDQNGISANKGTDLSSQTFPSGSSAYYTRQINIGSWVGKIIEEILITYNNPNVTAGQQNVTINSRFMNVSIISTNGTITQLLGDFGGGTTTTVDAVGGSLNTTIGGNTALATYLFQGNLDVISQHLEPEKQSVTVPALGALARLKGVKVSTALYQSITTDQALVNLFNAVGITNYTILDTGKTTLDWWWLANEDAFAAATTLLYTEGPGSMLFEDNAGNIYFNSRQYRLTNSASISSQATFSDSAEVKYKRPFSYDPGLKDIVNQATLTIKTRAAQALGVIWQYGAGVTITFAPNETKTFIISTTDPFTGALVPVSGTDYTLSAGGFSSVTLNNTSGAYVTLTMIANASGATIVNLQLRAQSVTVQTTTTVNNTVSEATSIANYGTKSYQLSIRAEIAFGVAQDLVNGIVSIYGTPRAVVTIAIDNSNYSRFLQEQSRRINDRITVVNGPSNLNSAFWIVYRQYVVQAAMLTASYGCEAVYSNNFGVWDTAVWGTSTFGF